MRSLPGWDGQASIGVVVADARRGPDGIAASTHVTALK
jgi:hypothetical protein